MTDSTSVLLFFGLPGSGKGTLSQLCVEHLGYEQLSTGNLCREHIARGTQIGQQIDFAIKSGKLVDDSLITSMVLEWFGQSAKLRVILDGFPRTSAQARLLNDFMKAEKKFSPLLVRLDVSESVVVDRLGTRRTCSNKGCQAVYSVALDSAHRPADESVCDRCTAPLVRRKDDEEEAIRERLKLYKTHERALLDFYRSVGYRLLELKADRPIEQVFVDLKQQLVGAQ